MRRWGLAAAAAMLALGLGAAEARTVRWSASGDPNTMDPHSQNVGTVTMVIQQIYDPLIHRSADLTLRPGLALSWTQVEPTRWRFVLRQGVKFHEGEAFNADDVVFSITRALQPTSNFGTTPRARRTPASARRCSPSATPTAPAPSA
jgi:peptide/nickel transport system substrate-binding protein